MGVIPVLYADGTANPGLFFNHPALLHTTIPDSVKNLGSLKSRIRIHCSNRKQWQDNALLLNNF